MPTAPDGLYEYTQSDPLTPLADLLNRGLGPANQAVRGLRDSVAAVDQTTGANGATLDAHGGRLTAAESLLTALEDTDAEHGSRLYTVEGAVGTVEGTVGTLEGTVADLAARLDIAEAATRDTGWRDVTSLLVNGWVAPADSASLLLRRVGDRVEFVMFSIDNTAATHGNFLRLPQGFRLPHGDSLPLSYQLGGGTLTILRGASAYAREYVLAPLGNVGGAERSTVVRLVGPTFWYTDDPWPVTPPGTPYPA